MASAAGEEVVVGLVAAGRRLGASGQPEVGDDGAPAASRGRTARRDGSRGR